jgi:uncharacterized protein involved in cysteine biosynthesis
MSSLAAGSVTPGHGERDVAVMGSGYAGAVEQKRRGAISELWRGATAFFGGVSFVARSPGALGWALLPAAIGVVLAVVLSGFAVWGITCVTARLVPGAGDFGAFGRLILDVVLGGAGVFAAIVLAMGIAQPLTRRALERITSPLDAGVPREQLGRPSGLLASLLVALSALGVTLPTVGALELVTLFAPEGAFVTEPIAFAVSALGLAWELLDHPLSRRGLGFGARLRWIKGSFWAVLGFATAAQLFLLIPGLDLFLLPIGIAGATRLVTSRPEARPRIPASIPGG